MGTFTDNLLKLTEFPFSYSFISLLVLIFGQGLNFGDEQFFNKLGPLLIIMGFVATTLSIIDPIGALQKNLIIGLRSKLSNWWSWLTDPKRRSNKLGPEERNEISRSDFMTLSLLKHEIRDFLPSGAIISSLIPWFLRGYIEKWRHNPRFLGTLGLEPMAGAVDDPFWASYVGAYEPYPPDPLGYMSDERRASLYNFVLYLRDSALRTVWVKREIDKITSMFYFIIVIVTFIIALIAIQGFEDKLLGSSQDSDNVTFSSTNTTTITITNESITNTSTIDSYAANPGNTKTTQSEDRSQQAKNIIIVFSSIALVAVSYMLYRRLRTLRHNARLTLKFLITDQAYLTARSQINMEDETFEKTLKEIEHYLDNGDWTLASFLVLSSLPQDYYELFSKKLKLELDRKIEEDKKKREEEKKFKYQDLGIY